MLAFSSAEGTTYKLGDPQAELWRRVELVGPDYTAVSYLHMVESGHRLHRVMATVQAGLVCD